MEKVYNVLLVEDDEVDRRIFLRAIKNTDFQHNITSIADASSLLSVLRNQDIDFIFLDYLLPDGDGLSVLKNIRKEGFDMPIVILTSQGDEKVAVDMMKAGAADYITKNKLTTENLNYVLRNIIRLQTIEKEKKHAENALRVSEARLGEAQHIARIGNWEIDLVDKKLYWSDEVYRIFNVDKYTYKNSFPNFIKRIYKDDREKVKNAINDGFEGKKFNTDFRFTLPNGVIKYANSQGYPVMDGDKNGIKLIGIVQDISDRKTFEEELIKAKDLAEKSVKIKEEFLASMSHEIRTPMNAIIGLSRVLLNTNLSDEQREYLNAIKVSGDHLLVIINDILDYSKIEAGKMSFEEKTFRLDETVKQITEILKTKSDEKGIILQYSLDEGLPGYISGDPVRLNQIMFNLVGNAIKFTENGQIKIVVKLINQTTEAVNIEFAVVDTGIGIPKDKIQSVFESFTQASSNITRKYGGTGLGLAIVKRLVTLQGGSLRVESEVGEGSTFAFQLSFKRANVIPKKINLKDNEEYYPELKGLRILLVEDNAINQLLAKKVLRDFEFVVDSADNGRIALEMLDNDDNYDIVLMDVHMPEMDGFEATSRIRGHENDAIRNLPIIAMTASVITSEAIRCIDAGMNDYVPKPFDAKVLYSKIAAFAFKSKQQNEPAYGKINHKVTDLKYLKELADGNMDFEKEMISMFLTQVPQNFENLKRSLESKNWDEVKKMAHKMKPNFGIIGVKSLTEVFQFIELNASTQSNLTEVSEKINLAGKTIARISSELDEELKILMLQSIKAA